MEDVNVDENENEGNRFSFTGQLNILNGLRLQEDIQDIELPAVEQSHGNYTSSSPNKRSLKQTLSRENFSTNNISFIFTHLFLPLLYQNLLST